MVLWRGAGVLAKANSPRGESVLDAQRPIAEPFQKIKKRPRKRGLLNEKVIVYVLMALLILKIGRYIPISMAPTRNASKTIMMGSSFAMSPAMASSTSSS